MSIAIRTYRPTDLENIVTLVNVIDTLEKIEDGTSREEMASELESPEMNARENVFVAEDEHGALVGYAQSRLAHEPTESSLRSWFAIHPGYHRTDLSTRLLTALYARAKARLAECPNEAVNFHTLVNALERERLVAVQAFGMSELRRFWQMTCALDQPIPVAQFPKGVRVRPYRLGEDDARVNDAVNEAFRDHFGSADHPLEFWQHWVQQSFFRPDLTLIAEDLQTHAIAGFSINTLNAHQNARLGIARGWVDYLGAQRPWRKKGLGTALLLESLKIFRAAGLTQAALGCDSENLTGATRIYERVGFQISKTRIAFRKPVRGSASTKYSAPVTHVAVDERTSNG